ncbi:hypothetical protein [Treponema zioleckii]|uniref:hypothetical protein n=1 Tax=Treponema zioleckii TaxID=331680 RepID=UPI00168A7D5F|nr:hypothetical protein [Treponema zioleckii]
MKKLLALAAVAIFSVSALFAENTFHVGTYFPITNLTVSDDDTDSETDFSSTGVGAFFDYTHVANGGFTFKIGTGIAYASTSDVKSYVNNEDLSGVDFDFFVGLGGSPIHNEKMTLSITGNTGLRVQNLSKTETFLGSEITTDTLSILFFIGPEVSYTIRFNEHVGLFGNLGVLYNVGVAAFKEIDDDVRVGYAATGFNIQPKIGVAFTL